MKTSDTLTRDEARLRANAVRGTVELLEKRLASYRADISNPQLTDEQRRVARHFANIVECRIGFESSIARLYDACARGEKVP